MTLQRIYTNWDDVRDATGTPSSRKRAAWREYLQTRPAIAYWGDSWFTTPLYRNLNWHSFARIEGISVRLGKPGFQAKDMCTRANCRNYAERLTAREFDLLGVSIGGNDALDKRLAKVFGDMSGLSAADAYQEVVDAGVFDGIRDCYETLLDAMSELAPQIRVVGHTYAPLVRIGEKGKTDIMNLGLARPLIGNVGPWLWRPMKSVLKNKAEAKPFADLLLGQGFAGVLAQIKRGYSQFSFADFRNVPGTQVESFWYDEIHPNEDGFAVLGAKYNEALRTALPAAKRAAVR
ncbi:hypothetical protein [Arenimonas sp.]|uniref:hypothetical protein n=1 Tax=Arenimonas sp. TaxID=1872635 RepID=UPI0039E3FCB5